MIPYACTSLFSCFYLSALLKFWYTVIETINRMKDSLTECSLFAWFDDLIKCSQTHRIFKSMM